MLRKLIVKLRRQPKPVRDNIAMALAGVFTAFIFTIWAYHLPVRMSAMDQNVKADTTESFSHIFDKMSEQVAAVKEALPEKPASEVTPSESENEYPAEVESGTAFSISTTSEPVASTSTDYTYKPEPKPVRIITTNNASNTASSTIE